MLKVLKFKGKNEDFFLCGCLHENHATSANWTISLWKMRGFETMEEHDAHQIKQWNRVCDENSVVFLLGDTIFGDPTGEKFLNFFHQLRFKTVWIQGGNHTSGYSQIYRKTLQEQFGSAALSSGNEFLFEVYPLELKLTSEKSIQFIPNYAELDINGQQIVICHYAIRSWNKMARNSWMIHSHEHAANRESDWLTTDCGKVIDVGYENLLKYNKGAPVSLDKLRKFMDAKAYLPEGHH